MKINIRVSIAGVLVVGLLRLLFMQGTYLVLPFAALLFAVLMTTWMGWKCLQGTDYSFFRFLGVCVLSFLAPAVLRSYVSGDKSVVVWKLLTSLGMLLFAFWPRHEHDDDEFEDEEDVYDDYESKDVMSVAPGIIGGTPSPDDLKKIEGIGPAIEQLLYVSGVTTYAELATTSYERLKEILSQGGDRFAMHDPFTRPDQASLARDGQRVQLETFQDLLDGGRHD